MKTPPPNPMFTPDAKPSLESVRQQFLSACESQDNGTPPSVEEFLVPFMEPERTSLRAQLEEIWKNRFRPTGSPDPAAARGTKSEQTAETMLNAPKKAYDSHYDELGTIDRIAVPNGPAQWPVKSHRFVGCHR
jgi:hypothetical protein